MCSDVFTLWIMLHNLIGPYHSDHIKYWFSGEKPVTRLHLCSCHDAIRSLLCLQFVGQSAFYKAKQLWLKRFQTSLTACRTKYTLFSYMLRQRRHLRDAKIWKIVRGLTDFFCMFYPHCTACPVMYDPSCKGKSNSMQFLYVLPSLFALLHCIMS